ncbi:hypothetical protein OV207_11840 [Corallococcus sp. BB11-1]|uniref:hypothetical protein n=1 Tax=Corallococcus sp. BB11-1 TaxID=2996783 RepID=UPI00226DC8E4|nr:hypothetical protein [Corallococcus sp. BB11-1]MCY1032152.1 hypothetical protein [Corallococcus sp. BB11-1]
MESRSQPSQKKLIVSKESIRMLAQKQLSTEANMMPPETSTSNPTNGHCCFEPSDACLL